MTAGREQLGRQPGRIILTDVTWLATFKRFPAERIPLIGRVALLVADWSRPQRGEAPMFDWPLLERLSVVRPAYPTAVFLPAGFYFLWKSVSGLDGMGVSILLYLLGLLVWSLVEYLVHRNSFHHEPKNRWQVALVYLFHGVHHAYPDDSRRWMMPLSASIPLATAFYFLFRLVLGSWTPGVFAGFIHGYLAYDLLHYFIHRGRMPGRIGRFLRQHHMAHHYAKPDRHFGVTSPLWDLVFRTR